MAVWPPAGSSTNQPSYTEDLTDPVKELRDMGVTVLVDDEGYTPHVPHQGSRHLSEYPWGLALSKVSV